MEMTDKLMSIFIKFFKIIIIPLFILLLCATLMLTNSVIPFIKCFAVDSFGNLYVGTRKGVEVYSEGTFEYSFSFNAHETYLFSILENDTLVFCTPTDKYYCDLLGNPIDSPESNDSLTYTQLQFQKNHFKSLNGDHYALKSSFGWTRIIKNGSTTVYSISVISFIVKIFFFASIAAILLIFILALKDLFTEIHEILHKGKA